MAAASSKRIKVPSGSLAYVVDPALRRHGYGTAMIAALLALPDLAHTEPFGAGVDPANRPSVNCLVRTGFRPLRTEPDWGARFITPCPDPTRTTPAPKRRGLRGAGF